MYLYHGSPKYFEEFALTGRRGHEATMGEGIYLTNNQTVAHGFVNSKLWGTARRGAVYRAMLADDAVIKDLWDPVESDFREKLKASLAALPDGPFLNDITRKELAKAIDAGRKPSAKYKELLGEEPDPTIHSDILCAITKVCADYERTGFPVLGVYRRMRRITSKNVDPIDRLIGQIYKGAGVDAMTRTMYIRERGKEFCVYNLDKLGKAEAIAIAPAGPPKDMPEERVAEVMLKNPDARKYVKQALIPTPGRT